MTKNEKTFFAIKWVMLLISLGVIGVWFGVESNLLAQEIFVKLNQNAWIILLVIMSIQYVNQTIGNINQGREQETSIRNLLVTFSLFCFALIVLQSGIKPAALSAGASLALITASKLIDKLVWSGSLVANFGKIFEIRR